MTTVTEAVEATFEHLYGGYRPAYNLLNGTITSGATTLVTELPTSGIAAGGFLAIDDELLLVKDVNAATKTVTVVRGFRATTAAAHSDDAIIEVNPRFPRHRVKAALRTEIRSWPESLYRVTSVNLDTVSGTSGYDLAGIPSDFYSLLDVQLGPRTASNRVDWTRAGYQLVRGADTAAFPSGAGIVLTSTIPGEARDFRVTVSVPFDTEVWENDTDLEEDCGLAASMVDIPPLGAAARLMVGRDVARSFGEGQGEPRHAEEVPAGFAGSIATFLRRETNRRIAEESAKLAALYPIRF